MNILGISAFYHDSAAAIIKDGVLVAAAQEERFSRKKHDAGFPENATRYCLRESGLKLSDIDYVVFYDKPLLKFERLLETYLSFAPRGLRAFLKSMPVWIKEKLFLKQLIRKSLAEIELCEPVLLFTYHHQSHAAAAFYPSPFQTAGVLCLDGVGEWATTSAWLGTDNKLQALWQLDFPHSLGLLYSAFTYYCGFRVNSGEYKLMGLAPYGEPKYEKQIRDELIDIKSDGSFRLNMDYFDYPVGLRMTNKKFNALFAAPSRKPETQISQREMDLASSIQKVTEDVVEKLVHSVIRETGQKQVCLAGGVALNCVANGKLLNKNIVEKLWIQPAAGDAGAAIGAAYSVLHDYMEMPRQANSMDSMSSAYLGPGFSEKEIITLLDQYHAQYQHLTRPQMIKAVATAISEEKVIGWFQGRMEFGPRALGNRSIIADPRSSEMQKTLNLKIKYRESFRPFAPLVLEEHLSEWFDTHHINPYMTGIAYVSNDRRKSQSGNVTGLDRLNETRSTIPAVTHLDYSARYQTVSTTRNVALYELMQAFYELTACPVLINTSFNVRGEPIVCTPKDALACFMNTEMDYLVMGNIVLKKEDQPSDMLFQLKPAIQELD